MSIARKNEFKPTETIKTLQIGRTVEIPFSKNLSVSKEGRVLSFSDRDESKTVSVFNIHSALKENDILLSFAPILAIPFLDEKYFLYGDDRYAILDLITKKSHEEKLPNFGISNDLKNESKLIYIDKNEIGAGSIYALDLIDFQKTLIAQRKSLPWHAAECPDAIAINSANEIALGLRNGKIEFWKNGTCYCSVGNSFPPGETFTSKKLAFSPDGKTLFDLNVLLNAELKESHIVRYFHQQKDGQWKQLNKVLDGKTDGTTYDLRLKLGSRFLIYHKNDTNLIFAIDLMTSQVYYLNNGKNKIKTILVNADQLMVTSESRSHFYMTFYQMESLIPQDLFCSELQCTGLALQQDVLKFTLKFLDYGKLFSLPFTTFGNPEYKKAKSKKQSDTVGKYKVEVNEHKIIEDLSEYLSF